MNKENQILDDLIEVQFKLTVLEEDIAHLHGNVSQDEVYDIAEDLDLSVMQIRELIESIEYKIR